MPLYEYECPSCGSRFERLTSFGAADEAECESCRVRARRLLSVIGGTVGTASAPTPTCGGGACGNC